MTKRATSIAARFPYSPALSINASESELQNIGSAETGHSLYKFPEASVNHRRAQGDHSCSCTLLRECLKTAHESISPGALTMLYEVHHMTKVCHHRMTKNPNPVDCCCFCCCPIATNADYLTTVVNILLPKFLAGAILFLV